ncbi:MAG: hypothetical protein EXS10_09260 [Phycisphaerales bacterium]|nr:hypothetical protein [Phycisphaerales bacterium]
MRHALHACLCLATTFVFANTTFAQATLHEVRADQPGADSEEYVEIKGAPGSSLKGYSLVIIGDDDLQLPPAQNGYIEQVITLSGTVPASGYFVVGKSTLSLAIPNLIAPLAIENADNVTILLVQGFVGAVGDDLDTNDDGTRDFSPWTTLADGVALWNGLADGIVDDYVYASNRAGPDAGFVPYGAWKCETTTQWNVGSQDAYSGIDSPGAANGACAPEPVVINEIRIDHPGTDTDEYFELRGAPGASLVGLTYIVIGDGTGGSGVIECVVPLGAYSLSGDGLLSVSKTPTLVFAGSVDVGPVAGINFENTDNVTHMLVLGFTGALAADLDTNNDGVLDFNPWTQIVDSVSLILSDTIPPVGTEYAYSPNRVGPDTSFVPGHVYRCIPTGGWKIGPFDGAAAGRDSAGDVNDICSNCGPGTGSCFVAVVTPGCFDSDCCNLVCLVDPTCCDTSWDAGCVTIAQSACINGNAAPILQISELRVSDPSATDINEYFELSGAPGVSLNGVTLVVISSQSAGVNQGKIEATVSCNGLSIAKDGRMLATEASFTMNAFPDALRFLSFNDSGTKNYYLVYNFTGIVGNDLDTNDDCVFDVTPWQSVIDSVALLDNEVNCAYASVSVGPNGTNLAPHFFRCADGSPRMGHYDPFDLTGYDTPGLAPGAICPAINSCGLPKGTDCRVAVATPGCSDAVCCDSICSGDPTCCEVAWDQACADRANCACYADALPAEVRINEIRTDDLALVSDQQEYFELRGAPGTSLSGFTYVVIGDGVTVQGSGVIECYVDLDCTEIPASGYFVAGTSTFSLVTANLVSPYIVFENSDNVTHMLVYNFTGTVGMDLDVDDDGGLDFTPWSQIVDSVSLIESATLPPVGTEYAYSANRVGPDTSGTTPSVPFQVSYCTATTAWAIGSQDPAAVGTLDTPGLASVGCDKTTNPCITDLNADGVTDAADLASLLNGWGAAGATDLDGNGVTDAADLAAMLNGWGACP